MSFHQGQTEFWGNESLSSWLCLSLQAETTFQKSWRSEGPWPEIEVNFLKSVANNRGGPIPAWDPKIVLQLCIFLLDDAAEGRISFIGVEVSSSSPVIFLPFSQSWQEGDWVKGVLCL